MGRPSKLTDEQQQEICQRYLAGETANQLAEVFGVNNTTISTAIKRQGGAMRSASQAMRTFSDEQEAEICTRYRRGESAIDLEGSFGVNRSAIYGILRRNGERIRSIKESQGGLDDSREADVCARYQTGESSPSLAKEMGVSPNAIYSILRRHGIKTRSSGAASRKLTDEQEQEICNRYMASETTQQLATAFGVSSGTIANVIRRQGRMGEDLPMGRVRIAKDSAVNKPAKSPGSSARAINAALPRKCISLRSPSEAHRKFTDEQEREICRRYLAGENSVQLSTAFGVVDCTIRKIIKRNGISLRSRSEARGGLSESGEADACRRYRGGESTPSIAAALGVSINIICRILKRHGIDTRPNGEFLRAFTAAEEHEICRRYLEGESTVQLGEAFGHTPSAISNALKRNGIERRAGGINGDTVQHVLDCTGRHTHIRECEFYLFELARYSETHCKPGISANIDQRVLVGGGEYGGEVLRLLFATRAEALFLEQAVLDATRGCADCPKDLWDWDGNTEVRAMPASDMVPIVLRLADELEELGCWEFAARYVPMTAAQRLQCQQRALQEVAA
jgi:transposase